MLLIDPSVNTFKMGQTLEGPINSPNLCSGGQMAQNSLPNMGEALGSPIIASGGQIVKNCLPNIGLDITDPLN